MHRTTVYLPERLKRTLERIAASRGCSEAQLIREAIEAIADRETPPSPRLPLFHSGQPRLAEAVDEALEGFGER